MQTGKWLVITEKPSVAADITKALGGFEKQTDYYESSSFVVTWAVGHILEFFAPEDIDPKYKRWLIQDLPIIPTQFEYKPKYGHEKRLNLIKSIAKKAEIVGYINACDAGREGELIFREIVDYFKHPKAMKRLWLQSMTTQAIRTEFAKLREGRDFDNLGDAARCRSESDWLIGMNMTRAMTRRLATRARKGDAWTVGRVQTPTLALVVKREMEVLAHRAVKYFTVEGRFETPTHEYSGQWFNPDFKKISTNVTDDDDNVVSQERDYFIFSEEKLSEILRNIEENKGSTHATETRKESKEIAPQLFDLTLLQREANRRFGLPASRTLQAAQRLYEKYKLITYPRTDTKYLPEDYRSVCEDILKKYTKGDSKYSKFSADILQTGLLNQERIFNDKEISDHFALIPTGEQPGDTLDGDDAKIFDLIMKRFLAAFMSHAIWAKVERITKVGAHHFRTRVQDLQTPGWRGVYGLDTEEESRLPKLELSKAAKLPDGSFKIGYQGTANEEHLTKPPARLTEAKLLFLMEHCGRSLEDEKMAEALHDKGIGTPATRAEIIENLIAKEYLQRIGRALKPTVKGIRLVDIAGRIPIDMLSSVELTGEMEYELKQVEKGERSRSLFMTKMINFTTDMIDKTKGFEYNSLYDKDPSLGKCPLCSKGEIVESFWNYRCTEKDCEFVVWKEKHQRYIDRSLMADALAKGRVGPLEFMTGAGASYPAWVVTTPKGLLLQDEAGNFLEAMPGTEAKVLAEYPVELTFLGMPGKIIETEVAYLCEFKNGSEPEPAADAPAAKPKRARKSAKSETSETETPAKVAKPKKAVKKQKMARMPKNLCGHAITLSEFQTYLTTGATPAILDFKSKKGRPFGASLHMKPDGSFEFKFVSRKKSPEAAAGANPEAQNGEPGATVTTVAAAKKAPARSRSKAKVVKKEIPETPPPTARLE